GLIVSIIVVLAAYSGYQFWQNQRMTQDMAGSAVYNELLEAMAVENRSDEQTSSAKFLAKQLQDEHDGTFYGISGALFLAKMAVESNDLETAQTELQQALGQGPSSALKPVILMRLAKVQMAKGDFDSALASLDKGQTQAFVGAFAELRGDIYKAKGSIQQARGAYQLALDSLESQDFSRKSILERKMDGLSSAEIKEVSSQGTQP
ncbi:MAG: tetratricopeptide repeat protein, partial [Cellvibrionaceae bacterium]|nr:tetratricopeptide repeat protein [Cellvibrionaceae bacterium]